MVQWLRCCLCKGGGRVAGSISGGGIKIPHALWPKIIFFFFKNVSILWGKKRQGSVAGQASEVMTSNEKPDISVKLSLLVKLPMSHI